MSGLEDHAGDIVRKSRMGLNVPLETILQKSGLNQEALARFEDNGRVDNEISWEGVCKLLELSPKKFQDILSGWTPTPVAQDSSPQLRQISTDDGGMQVNAFLVWDLNSREAALFDTGWNPAPINALLKDHSLTLKHLFITHQHHDHVAAMTPLRSEHPEMHLWAQGQGVPIQCQVIDGQTFTLGKLNIEARWTPGHAPDGVTYIVSGLTGAHPIAAIVGDAIFAGSMGGAPKHFALAKKKVREVVLALPGSTLICPGHGPMTTVDQENLHNPLF